MAFNSDYEKDFHMTYFSKTFLVLAAMVLATFCHGADKIEFGNITNSTEMYTAKAVDELIGEAGNITSNDVLSITESATNALVNALTSENAPLVVQKSLESSNANVATYANSAEVAYGLGTEVGIPASRTTESIFNQLDAATTTNDVCNIVTNEVLEGWDTSWTYTPKSISYEGRTLYPAPLGPYWGGGIWTLLVDDDDENPFILQADPEVYGEDASMIVFSGIPGTLTATRTPITRNALGLARLVDLPPLTNGLPEEIAAAESKAYSAATNYTDSSMSLLKKGGKYPLFVIDLNPSELRYWTGLELKATTNNFTTQQGMTFYTATGSNYIPPAEIGGIVHDWVHLYAAGKRVSSDIRQWISITNTAALNGYASVTLAIIVDPNLFQRDESKVSSDWLYESNPQLTWSYVRTGVGLNETDQDGKNVWRQIMPTKWYDEIPDWAIQPITEPNGTDVNPYIPPWQIDIENADTSYTRYTEVTNINQTVQYISRSSTTPSELVIQVPQSGQTKDWIVYVSSVTNVTIKLPSGYTWWLTSSSVTNDVKGEIPTGFYFSEASNGVFTVGRQEFVPYNP